MFAASTGGVTMASTQELRSAARRTALTRRAVVRGAAAAGLGVSLASLGHPRRGRAFARQGGNGTTLIVGLAGSPSDLDPHSQYDSDSTLVIRGIYEGLVGLKGGATDEFEGLVAERWEANADQSVWTFTLRPGLAFQDGSPCDSAAVKASYERLLAMDRGAVNVFSRFISDPAQMSTPDAGTIVFDLGVPQPLFLTAMASTYAVQIVNVKVALQHEVDGDFGNAWLQLNAEGTGTGGWKLVSFEPGEEVILERNPAYWRGWDGNHFARVIVRVVEENATMRQLVEAGDVDIVDRFSVQFDWIDELKRVPTLAVDVADSTLVEYYAMTVAGPLASPEARQAMGYAFPYQDVLAGEFAGYASRANSPVAPTVRGYQMNGFFFETDLAKARALLAAAGLPEGTALRMATNSRPGDPVHQLFAASLASLGITLTVEVIDQSTYMGLLLGDTPAAERPNFFTVNWWPDYNDAWNALYPTISCDSWGSKGANAGFYCNEEVDALLAQAKDAATLDRYSEVLDQVQTIITQEDVPVLAYAQPKWTTVLQANIAGFVFNPINLGTYDFWALSRRA
jgi:peptide/nickel transport system substrate-binding protein